MPCKPELFVGITSWNSELFLPLCLRSINAATPNIKKRIVVLDNYSDDSSVESAKKAGAEVLVRRCNQAEALNTLVALADAAYTLLLHADVVLLSPAWFELCRSKIDRDVILASPEDIGCGPLTRPFGAGMPESSFLFFATEKLKKTRIWKWSSGFPPSLPRRKIDFFGPHITHHLPARLRERDFDWHPMQVHFSDRLEKPLYVPPFIPPVWSKELSYLRYGLGNFYSIDGTITHYHNWYDRVDKSVDVQSRATTGGEGKGFPSAYIRIYTEAFINDYCNGKLVLPTALKTDRLPVAL